MSAELLRAEEHVAHEVTAQVICQGGSHYAYGRAGRYRLVGLGVELHRHPSGVRHVAPPVVVAFDAKDWLRICLLMQEMRRHDPVRGQS